jgi:L-lactate utilization protein LutB
MPVLRNTRWEAFAVHIAQRPKTQWSIGRCYAQSGFKARNHSADQLGSQLLKNVEIKARIVELRAPTARKAGYTLDTLVARIEAAIAAAQADGAHSAVAANHNLILKIIELVEERNATEAVVGGGAMTSAEILQHIVDELGPHDVIEICGQFIEVARNRLAEQAIVVS